MENLVKIIRGSVASETCKIQDNYYIYQFPPSSKVYSQDDIQLVKNIMEHMSKSTNNRLNNFFDFIVLFEKSVQVDDQTYAYGEFA